MDGSDVGVVARLRAALPTGGQLPDEVFEQRHRALTLLLWLHAIALPVVGVMRGQSLAHSLLEAAVVAGLALGASVPGASQAVRSTLTTLGLMTSSAVLVHFFDGLIELHFHFFVMVAAISLYQRWTPYLVGVGFVAVHHGIVGTLAPADGLQPPGSHRPTRRGSRWSTAASCSPRAWPA